MRGTDEGPIKIGRTSGNPWLRVDDIQTGYPYGQLAVVGLIRGPVHVEKQIHQRFKDMRLRGEWFRAERKLIDFIKALPLPR